MFIEPPPQKTSRLAAVLLLQAERTTLNIARRYYHLAPNGAKTGTPLGSTRAMTAIYCRFGGRAR
jgi:hypothetical protein